MEDRKPDFDLVHPGGVLRRVDEVKPATPTIKQLNRRVGAHATRASRNTSIALPALIVIAYLQTPPSNWYGTSPSEHGTAAIQSRLYCIRSTCSSEADSGSAIASHSGRRLDGPRLVGRGLGRGVSSPAANGQSPWAQPVGEARARVRARQTAARPGKNPRPGAQIHQQRVPRVQPLSAFRQMPSPLAEHASHCLR